MGYFRITAKNGTKTQLHRPIHVRHNNGDQILFAVIDDIAGLAPCPANDIPYALEVDSWGDDQATVGDNYDTDLFTVECITEQEFRETTWQEDVPTALLKAIVY